MGAPALLIFAAAALAVPAVAQITRYEYTDLTSAFPPGGRQGTRVTVTFHGAPLDDFRSVRVSGTGVTVQSIQAKSRTLAQAVLEIAPDAPLGRRSLRVVGKGGVSDPAWFIVGQHPEVVEQEPNNSPGEGRLLELPVVVNARLDAGADIDQFRFRARAGETVTLALQGQALDSQSEKLAFLDTTLTIYDATGQVVARNEDFHTLDPFLAFRPKSAGEYTAEVREVGFGGGDAAVYRLTLGSVPWVTSLYPAGGRRGESVEVAAAGPNLPDNGKLKVQIPAGASEVLELAPVPGAANLRPFLVGELPEVLEQEPNDSPVQANLVALPAVFNGRVEREGDVDSFQLRLRAGETVCVDVTAGRVLRSPVDLTLTVLGPDGKQLAYNDDGPYTFEVSNNRVDSLSGDPRVELKAVTDGLYTVLIRDAAGRGDPDCVYRATVELLRPRFTLSSFYDNPVIMGPGATGAVPVQVTRFGGFAGPVRLRIGGLPAGFAAGDAYIPRATTSEVHGPSALVTITAPANATAGTLVPFWIEGEAEIGGRQVVVRSTPMGHLSQAGDHAIRRPTDSYLACVVQPQDFQLRTEVRALTAAPGEPIRIPVNIEKLRGFTGILSLIPLRGTGNAHQVLSFGPPQTLLEEGGRYLFPFTLPQNTLPGEYTFVLCRPLAGDFRGNVVTVSTPPIRLTVTTEPRRAEGAN